MKIFSQLLKYYLIISLGFWVFTFNSCTKIDLSEVSKDISLMDQLNLPVGSTSISVEEIVEANGLDFESIDFNLDKVEYSFSIANPISSDGESIITEDSFNSVSLFLDLNNGLPLSLRLKLALLDEYGDEIPSRFSNSDILNMEAAKTNSAGEVIENTTLKETITFTNEDIVDLKMASDIEFTFTLDGDSRQVKITLADNISAKIALSVNGVNLNLDDLTSGDSDY